MNTESDQENALVSLAQHWIEKHMDVACGIVANLAKENKWNSEKYIATMLSDLYLNTIPYKDFLKNVLILSLALRLDPKEILISLSKISRGFKNDKNIIIAEDILQFNRKYWQLDHNDIKDILGQNEELQKEYINIIRSQGVEMEQKFNCYALLIGIAEYTNITSLSNHVINDVNDVNEILYSKEHCSYKPENIKVLINSRATTTAILDAFKWLSDSAAQKDTVIIFFTGHGGRFTQEKENNNYLLPYDFDPKDIKNTAIESNDLTSLMKSIGAERLVLFLDCCHSGGIGNAKETFGEVIEYKSGFDESRYAKLQEGVGRVIIASSRSEEVSIILPDMRNSLFSYYLINALKGAGCKRNDGIVRIFDIFEYISNSLKEKRKKLSKIQHPIIKTHVEENFAITLYNRDECKYLKSNLPNSLEYHKNLRKLIIKHFNKEDLELLCSDIEDDFHKHGCDEVFNVEVVGGDSLENKVNRMIKYLDKRDLLPYLLKAIVNSRPNLRKEIYNNE